MSDPREREIELSAIAGLTIKPVPRKKNGRPRKQKVTVTQLTPFEMELRRVEAEVAEVNSRYRGTFIRYETVSKKANRR